MLCRKFFFSNIAFFSKNTKNSFYIFMNYWAYNSLKKSRTPWTHSTINIVIPRLKAWAWWHANVCWLWSALSEVSNWRGWRCDPLRGPVSTPQGCSSWISPLILVTAVVTFLNKRVNVKMILKLQIKTSLFWVFSHLYTMTDSQINVK